MDRPDRTAPGIGSRNADAPATGQPGSSTAPDTGSPDLTRLLEPRSVAVIGASANAMKIGGRPIAYMRRLGFDGTIYPINPGRTEVQGLTAYPSLEAVGRPVDLAVIATPADTVEAAVDAAIAAGVGALVIFSSGFAEHTAEGAALQARLGERTAAAGVLMLGPNCLGAINSRNRLAASFTTSLEGHTLREGSFSFVSQSGALGAYWLDMVLKQGMGVASWITTGNEGGVTAAEAIDYLARDPATEVIGVYLEDVKDGAALMRAARTAARHGKPILAIKAGRSEAGAAAAASHTGALAGEDARYQAMFDQFGIVRVNSLAEMMDTARLMLRQPAAAGKRAGIVSVSGGAGVMLADGLSENGFTVPPFSAPTRERLRAVLPAFAGTANPLDITGSVVGQSGMFRAALEILQDSDEHDVIVFFIGLMHSIAEDLAAALTEVFEGSSKQVALVWMGAPPEIAARLEAAGIPLFPDIPPAVDAVARAGWAVAARARAAELAPPLPQRAAGTAGEAMSEHASKALLALLCGLPFPRHALVRDAGEVDAALAELSGPLAIKLQSPDMLHKSEHGAVVLAVEDPRRVREEVTRMVALAEAGGFRCEGVLLQEMGAVAHELIVGLKRDATFGLLLLIGRGGVEVEVRPDMKMAYLPLDAAAIARMIEGLATAVLFQGHRGGPSGDIAALADQLATLCAAFAARPDLVEIEINPLALLRDGRFSALDALIVKAG